MNQFTKPLHNSSVITTLIAWVSGTGRLALVQVGDWKNSTLQVNRMGDAKKLFYDIFLLICMISVILFIRYYVLSFATSYVYDYDKPHRLG